MSARKQNVQWCYFMLTLTAWLICHCLSVNAFATVGLGVPPKVWVFMNDASGIYEYDYFSVFSLEYRYMSVYIDHTKLPQMQTVDEDAQNAALQMMHQHGKMEVFVTQYRFPSLRNDKKKHNLRITVSNERDKDGLAMPVAMIKVNLVCVKVPLTFFTGETFSCTISNAGRDAHFLPRPNWLPHTIEDLR